VAVTLTSSFCRHESASVSWCRAPARNPASQLVEAAPAFKITRATDRLEQLDLVEQGGTAEAEVVGELSAG
jgi:hypothetical protein